MPAFRVVNFSNLKVTADVAEAYTDKINNGDEVIVYLPDIKTGNKCQSNFCKQVYQSYQPYIYCGGQTEIPCRKPKGQHGCHSEDKRLQASSAFVLPVNLVQSDNKGQYVLIAQQEQDQYIARKQTVETGQIYNGLAEITEGLEAGQKVITGGYLNLKKVNLSGSKLLKLL